jgi:hypothetical protein
MRRALALGTALAFLLLLPTPVLAVGGGVISVKCGPSHVAQVDPIVSPGAVSAHEHEFFANRSVNADSTTETMLTAGTTCPLSADTAGYWAPTLQNPSKVRVFAAHMFAYYRSPSDISVQPFPSGLKIVAGGDTLNPPKPTLPQRSLSWACTDSGPFSTVPFDCGDKRIKAHIHFPNCWDGVNLDSPDHRSHMAYSVGKTCPASHPVQVPKLSMHITYRVKDATGYTISSGSGTTLHADFWSTWKQDTLAFLVDHCLNGGRSCKQLDNAKAALLGAP